MCSVWFSEWTAVNDLNRISQLIFIMVKQRAFLQAKRTRSLTWIISSAANQSADILSLIRWCLWQALVHCTLHGHCSLPTAHVRLYLLCHITHRELVQSPKIMYSSGLPQATDNVGHRRHTTLLLNTNLWCHLLSLRFYESLMKAVCKSSLPKTVYDTSFLFRATTQPRANLVTTELLIG